MKGGTWGRCDRSDEVPGPFPLTGAETCNAYRANTRGNAFCGGGLWQLYMHHWCHKLVSAGEHQREEPYSWVPADRASGWILIMESALTA